MPIFASELLHFVGYSPLWRVIHKSLVDCPFQVTTAMRHPPNQVFTVFSFIGFILCAIPFYWHLEAWNVGTCLYMAWTGLGCLIQCINSIVWNKNMIDKAPVYCDIAVHIQVGLNVAISACSLCINRRLYKIATAKGVITDNEKRREIIVDLLIGLGIPILQIAAEYVVSGHRYNLFEDFGPVFAILVTPPSFFLFYAWPLAVGCVSFVYCSMTIHHFYKRGRQFREISPGVNRGRYFRLMALSSVDMIASIPLATYMIVRNAQLGVTPWISWDDTHSNYSRVIQIAAFIWKNDPNFAGLELYRWLLVACAFVFFAFFGFADEARQHYRLVYVSLVSRIGFSTPSRNVCHPSHSTLVFPHIKNKSDATISLDWAASANKRNPAVSSTDQLSISSTYLASGPESNIEKSLPSITTGSSSVDSFESGSEGQSLQPDTIAPALNAEYFPAGLPGKSESTPCEYSNDADHTV
ncbi:STE3-domain-containing protein [Russula earlei]|uniref:STE3-domain-containing protein n=1 Tax=Russula earlei TaxID=71964 RepID=A0ACC0UDV4_9AGAM|nr:STE3-domain-containing protein [Russula earlei]